MVLIGCGDAVVAALHGNGKVVEEHRLAQHGSQQADPGFRKGTECADGARVSEQGEEAHGEAHHDHDHDRAKARQLPGKAEDDLRLRIEKMSNTRGGKRDGKSAAVFPVPRATMLKQGKRTHEGALGSLCLDS